jgi:hypothetical protein
MKDEFHVLDNVNLTELVEMARKAELGNSVRDRESLYAALEDGEVVRCPLDKIRSRMQAHIKKNYRRLKTQLPGCTGECTTYGCPDLIVQRCWAGSKDEML